MKIETVISIVFLLYIQAVIGARSRATIQATVVPGGDCSVRNELGDGRSIHTLKINYFSIDGEGRIDLIEESQGKNCVGFSPSNIIAMKKYSSEQYATVVADSSSVAAFLRSDGKLNTINSLSSFVVEYDLTGIEIDFQGSHLWSLDIYDAFLEFVAQLGTVLNGNEKKLIVSGPAIANDASHPVWKWEDFEALPVDFVEVMAMDRHNISGIGNPIAPIDWISSVCDSILEQISNRERIIVAIPAYGYTAKIDGDIYSKISKSQAIGLPGFGSATRDPSSHELTWRYGNAVNYIIDSESLNYKRDIIEAKGIKHISVKQLGGNDWFNVKVDPVGTPVVYDEDVNEHDLRATSTCCVMCSTSKSVVDEVASPQSDNEVHVTLESQASSGNGLLIVVVVMAVIVGFVGLGIGAAIGYTFGRQNPDIKLSLRNLFKKTSPDHQPVPQVSVSEPNSPNAIRLRKLSVVSSSSPGTPEVAQRQIPRYLTPESSPSPVVHLLRRAAFQGVTESPDVMRKPATLDADRSSNT